MKETEDKILLQGKKAMEGAAGPMDLKGGGDFLEERRLGLGELEKGSKAAEDFEELLGGLVGFGLDGQREEQGLVGFFCDGKKDGLEFLKRFIGNLVGVLKSCG